MQKGPTLHFCPECNNLLYPEADNSQGELYHYCKSCSYRESTSGYCVYQHHIKQQQIEQETNHRDMTLDMTLPRSRNVRCKRCGYNEVVYYQIHVSSEQDQMINLRYQCCNESCKYTFAP